MGMIVKGLENIANSKIGTRFFKWADTKKGQDVLNNSLPTAESFLSVTCYTVATERQDLDRRRKNLLHIQNWTPAVIGMGIGTYLNRKVSKFGEHVIQHLDSKQVPNMHKVINATKVFLPLAMTGFLMRLFLPVCTAFVSGEVEAKKAELQKKKKLDIKV